MAHSPSGRIDTRVAKALSHPLRSHIFTILSERVASPNELARLIGAPLQNVSYHVRALRELECVELVDTARRRGATEHYYRAVTRPLVEDAHWEQVPMTVRTEASRVGLRLIWSDAMQAIRAGTFEGRPDRHLSRTPLVLDAQGWREVNALLRETYSRADRIAADSAQRLQDRGAEGVSTRLAMLHFEAAPD